MKIDDILLEHYHKYPLMRVQDFIKLIFQGEYGCEHAICDNINAVKAFFFNEMKSVDINQFQTDTLTERLSDNFIRVNFAPFIIQKKNVQLLWEIFYASAQYPNGNDELFVNKLDDFVNLVKEKKIDLPFYSTKKALINYLATTPPKAISHSPTFRLNYQPHYRVVDKNMFFLFDAIDKINELLQYRNLIVAIDGHSGCGKTTLTNALVKYYGARCQVIHADDFFLPIEQKTKERLNEIGGNIDYDRLYQLVHQISLGEMPDYQKYDCKTNEYNTENTKLKQITFVEGVYSCQSKILPLYDFVIKLTASKEVSNKRIFDRNENMYKSFVNVWIPLEDKYFDNLDLSNTNHIVLDTSSLD